MADAQKHLQTLSDDYQKLQLGQYIANQLHILQHLAQANRHSFTPELQEVIEAREKLEAQQQENKSVQKEFSTLDDDANIYKLIGPVLLKQDKTDAVMAVDGRLAFIEKEIKRIEKQITDIQEKSEKKKAEVIQFQTQMQQQASAASA
ncbi:Prefoldin subunit 6 [Emydomyces testavorans]|uniref:Prefoldin subunit 6 n=1 Tax=Emydomyces testavorans TaxID=2070801 RepID=A0AAF0DLQ3_9EURO|nr:Prefoldin subunit 6 [Emydomyces testavorans]